MESEIHLQISEPDGYPDPATVELWLMNLEIYFERYKGRRIKDADPVEVNKMLALAEKAKAAVYQEIDVLRPMIISKRELAEGSGIPYATFFRKLKKKKFNFTELREIYALITIPDLIKAFADVSNFEKSIQNLSEEDQEVSWALFLSLSLHGRDSILYKTRIRNKDEFLSLEKKLIDEMNEWLTRNNRLLMNDLLKGK